MPRRARIAGESDQAAAGVRKIYAELAARPTERGCSLRAGCCQFHLTGKTPYLTAGEALVAARAIKATGRRSMPARDDGACPLLDHASAKCLIYDSRPFGCRTHFCQAAGGPYPRRLVADLIHKLEAIGRGLGSGEARPLPAAVREHLA